MELANIELLLTLLYGTSKYYIYRMTFYLTKQIQKLNEKFKHYILKYDFMRY